jgi:predicted  nucleic acid-binding Zn-ribbon protein
MADEPIDLNRERFNRIDAKLDRILDDLQDVKVRMTSMEENYGATSRRLDRIERDVSHIKKRLDLVEA